MALNFSCHLLLPLDVVAAVGAWTSRLVIVDIFPLNIRESLPRSVNDACRTN